MSAVLCPRLAPPSIAELEAMLAAHGITGLGSKPLTTCPKCQALAPNHRVGCGENPMPDPDRPVCSCGYPVGSLGCCGGAG